MSQYANPLRGSSVSPAILWVFYIILLVFRAWPLGYLSLLCRIHGLGACGGARTPHYSEKSSIFWGSFLIVVCSTWSGFIWQDDVSASPTHLNVALFVLCYRGYVHLVFWSFSGGIIPYVVVYFLYLYLYVYLYIYICYIYGKELVQDLPMIPSWTHLMNAFLSHDIFSLSKKKDLIGVPGWPLS